MVVSFTNNKKELNYILKIVLLFFSAYVSKYYNKIIMDNNT